MARKGRRAKRQGAPKPAAQPGPAENAGETPIVAPSPDPIGAEAPLVEPAPDDAEARRRSERRWRRSGLGVLAIALVLLGFRLTVPQTYIYDECYQAFTAHRLFEGDVNIWNPWASVADMRAFSDKDVTKFTRYEWVHPPGAKLLIGMGIAIAGFRPSAARIGGVVFGLLLLVAVWRLGARLHSERIGVVAMAACTADGMWFVLSRTAMADIYVTTLIVWGAYTLLRWWTGQRSRWLIATGVVLGAGVAVKWSALSMIAGTAVLTAARIAWEARRRSVLRDAAAWAIGFVVIPPVVYLAVYLPFFASGHTWSDFVVLHDQMIAYHRTLRQSHAYASRWWEWPLLLRSVWFFGDARADGVVRVVYALGNPLIWWPLLPALVAAAYRFRRARGRDLAAALVLGGFCGVWLPWAIIGRTAYVQYLMPAVPFGILGIVLALEQLGRRWILPTYIAGCVLVFAWFYPILAAVEIDQASLEGSRWFWLDGWR